jgi:small conductance mechanosensitive channel
MAPLHRSIAAFAEDHVEHRVTIPHPREWGHLPAVHPRECGHLPAIAERLGVSASRGERHGRPPEQIIDVIVTLVSTWGLRVIGAIAVLVAGRMVASGVRRGIRRALEHREVDATLVPFTAGLAYYFVLTVVVIAVLSLFGIQTTSLVAVLGAAGLAVGLALQGTLANFAAGVMLLVLRPFRAGDVIEAAGSIGKVQSISYGDDVTKAIAAIEEVLRADDRVLSEPAPAVFVLELADSAVNIAVRPWCATSDYLPLRGDLVRRVREALEGVDCSIPFPQRELRVIPAATPVASA